MGAHPQTNGNTQEQKTLRKFIFIFALVFS